MNKPITVLYYSSSFNFANIQTVYYNGYNYNGLIQNSKVIKINKVPINIFILTKAYQVNLN